MDKKLLIFDWDGTIVDSADHIVACVLRAAAELGWDACDPNLIRERIGISLEVMIPELFPCASMYKDFLTLYRRFYFDEGLSPLKLFPGVRETLLELSERGLCLAVATGKSRMGLDISLRESGLESLFSFSRCADETASKPDPRMLHELLSETGISVCDALMVGDSVYDLQMAKAAGMDSVGVTYGVHSREDFMACHPLFVIDHFNDLLDHFPVLVSK